MKLQLALFDEPLVDLPVVSDLKTARSGTFVDNMVLPVHRWFRYSAGFAAEWVEQVLDDWQIGAEQVVLDPFAGSGTVPVVCDNGRIRSVAVDAHPMVARICKAKLSWSTPVERFTDFAGAVIRRAQGVERSQIVHSSLIQRSFDADTLAALDCLKVSLAYSGRRVAGIRVGVVSAHCDSPSDLQRGHCSMAIHPSKQDKEQGRCSAARVSAATGSHEVGYAMDAGTC